jgi:D-alanyl-D-alanine carboxypeptidase
VLPEKETRMPEIEPTVVVGAAGRRVDRRTLLVGAAGALAAAGLARPARAAGSAAVAARSPRFDPVLGRRLQRTLREALRDPSVHAPGTILDVRGPKLGAWTGVAGLGRIVPDVPMRPADRFRAGSIAKPFVSVVVLQLAERGRLSLDARLPDVLPASVTSRFPTAAEITVRMLLGHRSGIPEWLSEAVGIEIARHPRKAWKVAEFLDLAAAQPPVFAPGAGFFYSNTDYNLLGLVIERITGRSWRHEVTRAVIRPLRLTRTDLPASGHRSIKGAHAHGYGELDGKAIDLTGVYPSMAGAAGGSALVTTVHDLARFIDALRGPAVPPPCDAAVDAGAGPGAGRGRRRRVRARRRAARHVRRRRADRPPRRHGRVSNLRRPRAPAGRDDDVRPQRRGRPDAAGPPGGAGARGDPAVTAVANTRWHMR